MFDKAVGTLAAWDKGIARRLTASPGFRWQWVLSGGAHLGDGLLWALVGAAAVVFGGTRLRALALRTAVAAASAMAICTAIKYWVRRPRPQEQPRFYALRYDRFSFPSGHAARMATIAVVTAQSAPIVALAGHALALVVGTCRVAVGVHYPSDVMVGLLIGWLCGWGLLQCV